MHGSIGRIKNDNFYLFGAKGFEQLFLASFRVLSILSLSALSALFLSYLVSNFEIIRSKDERR